MTILLVIAVVTILYVLIVLMLQIPGCTGNCMQGRLECDCPLGEKKNDIQQDKRP
jgi:hypothetical protein